MKAFDKYAQPIRSADTCLYPTNQICQRCNLTEDILPLKIINIKEPLTNRVRENISHRIIFLMLPAKFVQFVLA